MKINEKIRVARKAKNLSQEEVASQLSMSTNGYSKIERGESKINTERLEQIANILDMDILELISVGERNVVLFQESDHNLNIIGASEESQFMISQLKEAIFYKDKLLESQQREIETLRQMLAMLQQNTSNN